MVRFPFTSPEQTSKVLDAFYSLAPESATAHPVHGRR